MSLVLNLICIIDIISYILKRMIMPVYKLIFRLDFNLNFNIIKNQGNIFETLQNGLTGKTTKFLDFGENVNNRLIFARYIAEDKHFFKQLNIQPKNIDGSFENVKGVEINKLIFDETGFLSLSKTAGNLCREFKINEIKRSGLRIIYLNKISGKKQKIKDAFFSLFKNEPITKLSNCLGQIEDYGIVFNGITTEKIKYHLQTGPIKQDEFKNYFEFARFEFPQDDYPDFLIDLDLYEENFLLSEREISKLYKPIIVKAEQIVREFEDILTINLKG